jgi:uncharacterized membrane protein YgcG
LSVFNRKTKEEVIVRKLDLLVACVTILVFCGSGWADVAGDITAGATVSQVVGNGLRGGLAIETVVAQAIDAGVDPVAVVTAAIAAKPGSAYAVINAAVTARPALATVILKAVLANTGVAANLAITAATSPVASDADAVARMRTAALESGVPQATADAAVARALTVHGGKSASGSADRYVSGSASAGGTFFPGGGSGGGGGGRPASPSR